MATAPKRAKLTKGYVDRVRPATKDDFHWDTDVKGFGLRITPTGKITFVVQGRIDGSGKEARITIGAYGVFTVDQARSVAREQLRTMRMGTDPRDVKRQDEALRVTLRTVADSYFGRPGKLKESTRNEMDRHIKMVLASWENKPIAAITEEDVRKRYREMATRGMRGKPAIGSANLSMTTLRTLINYASRQYRRSDGSPLIAHNPVLALKDDWIALKPRTSDIDAKMVGQVWHELSDMRSSARNADARACVDLARFLLLTGARRSEGSKLKWDRVNLEEGWFHLPDPKNHNPVWIPLGSQAVSLLRARKPDDEQKDASPYCFPSRGKAGHVMDPRAPMERISRVAGLHLSAHALRRTFVSIAVATLGIDLHKIELLTNHVPKGITSKHYLQTSRLQYLQPEVQAIGDWVEQQTAITEAKANGCNIASLPQCA